MVKDYQLSGLLLASLDMREVTAGCDFLSALIGSRAPVDHDLVNCVVTGIVVSYCRPWGNGNQGLKMADEFQKFPEETLKRTHESMFEFRVRRYAHCDRINAFEKVAVSDSPAQFRKVFLHVDGAGNVTYRYAREDLDLRDVPKVRALAQFQLNRMIAANERFSRTKVDKCKLPPGSYELGVDFPPRRRRNDKGGNEGTSQEGLGLNLD